MWEEQLQADPDKDFLLNGIVNGFQVVKPNIMAKSVYCNNYKSATSSPNRAKVEKQIMEEIRLNRYVICNEPPVIVSALGAIPKPDSNDIRLIHDCSRPIGYALNDYANPDSFSFNTVDAACEHIKRGYYMAKLDLKSAYRSVPICPSQYIYTGLHWHFQGNRKSTYMYDTRLMFGASQAVGIFHRISNSVVRMIQCQYPAGKVINYLDDFLIIAPSKQLCHEIMQYTVTLLLRLGFEINWQKVFLPSTSITFLGILIDSLSLMLFIPSGKLSEILTKAKHWLSKKCATKRELQSLAGIIAWGAKCVRAIRPMLRSIIELYKPLKASHHHARISNAIKADIAFFMQWCTKFNGVSFVNRQCIQPRATICSDASLIAGAACYANDFVYANWAFDAPALVSASIYCKELAAVLLAFRRWAPQWKDSCVLILTDNQGVLYSIRRGLSRHPLANYLLKQLLYICALYNIYYDVQYINTKHNVLADALSRLHEPHYFCIAAHILLAWGRDIMSPWYNWLYNMSPYSMSYLLYRYGSEGEVSGRSDS